MADSNQLLDGMLAGFRLAYEVAKTEHEKNPEIFPLEKLERMRATIAELEQRITSLQPVSKPVIRPVREVYDPIKEKADRAERRSKATRHLQK